jgi:DHA1 family multidrug resistance protein-like MFS transporter
VGAAAGGDSLETVSTLPQQPEIPGTMPAPGPAHTDRGQLVVVCVASFVVWMGFGAILPYLPIFLREEAYASMGLIGVVAAGYSVGTFLLASPLGRLSDVIGRKPVIIFGVVLYAVSTFLFVVTTQPEWFVVFRFLEGVGTAAVTPAGQALLADISPENERSRAFGWLVSSQFGGLVFGPALAVLLFSLGKGAGGLWGFRAIFLFGAVVSALTAVALGFALREPEHVTRRRMEATPRPPIRTLLTPPIVAFVILAFTTEVAFGTYEVVWSIYLRDLGASMGYIGFTWVAFSVPMLFAFLGGRLADRYNRFLLMFSGYMISAIAWLYYGITTNLTAFIVVNVIEGIAVAWSFPAKQAFLTQVSPARWLGTVTGMESTAMQVAILIGSLTAPLLYDVIGGLVITVSGGLALLGILVTAPVLHRAWHTAAAAAHS